MVMAVTAFHVGEYEDAPAEAATASGSSAAAPSAAARFLAG